MLKFYWTPRKRKKCLTLLFVLMLSILLVVFFRTPLSENRVLEVLDAVPILPAPTASSIITITKPKVGLTNLSVLYNRVPKSGSRSLISIMKSLGKKKNIKYIHSHEYWKQRMKLDDQKKFVKDLMKLQRPFIYDMHLHFIDFERFNQSNPIYINMVRDPIDRLVSSYYFNRFGDTINKYMVKYFKGTDQEKNQTFDECVLLNKTECQLPNNIFYILPFFCGQDQKCREPSKFTLELAKKNVMQHYLFVGILEEFETTVKIFEQLLPQVFKGATSLLPGLNKNSRSKMKSLNNRVPSSEARKIMEERLSLEYEFYYFIQQRFNQIKQSLKIT